MGGAVKAVSNVINPISSIAGAIPVVGPIAGPVAGFITGGPLGAATSIAGQARRSGRGCSHSERRPRDREQTKLFEQGQGIG